MVIDSLQASGMIGPAAILDPNPALWGTSVLGVPVLGGDDLLPELVSKGATRFVAGVGGVGDNQARIQVFQLGLSHGLMPLTVFHPNSVRSSWAAVGAGTVVFPMAVINAGAVLGENVIVNSGAIVEHDCNIGDHVHLATGCRLSATVTVGACAHIGAGATVRQGIFIGEGAVVGAGAVVVEDVEPWTVVAGTPARILEKANRSAS